MKYSKIRDVKSPSRGTDFSAGIDFYVPNDFLTTDILPNGSLLIPSGIKVNIPHGYCLLGIDKSGVATKKGLILGAKLIDEDYQGEVHLHIINVSQQIQRISAGDKIAQFVLLPVSYENFVEVPFQDLYSTLTSRGEGGFGSTGEK